MTIWTRNSFQDMQISHTKNKIIDKNMGKFSKLLISHILINNNYNYRGKQSRNKELKLQLKKTTTNENSMIDYQKKYIK